MAESIAKRLARLESLDSIALKKLLGSVLTDLQNIQTDIASLDAGLDTMASKLNSDTGVTDVNYAGAAAMTSGTLNTTS